MTSEYNIKDETEEKVMQTQRIIDSRVLTISDKFIKGWVSQIGWSLSVDLYIVIVASRHLGCLKLVVIGLSSLTLTASSNDSFLFCHICPLTYMYTSHNIWCVVSVSDRGTKYYLRNRSNSQIDRNKSNDKTQPFLALVWFLGFVFSRIL